MPSRFERRLRVPGMTAGFALMLAMAGCGTVLLNDSGSLTRYDRLVGSEEVATRAKLYIDRAATAAARTIRIIPTTFSEAVSGPGLTSVERRLVANAADRALCYELSLRYDVVSGRKADLTVRAAVTRVELTGLPAAGATIATSAGVSIASQVGVGFATSVGRVPIPRIPIGLGSITIEAEALDGRHEQRAAMVWGGAANSFTSQPRFSPISDAYDLAGEFGQDWGGYLATGVDPFKAPLAIPSYDRIRITTLGEAPLDPDCEAFGRAPGVDGIAADYIGLPPEYTDKGPLAPVR
ncbi:hypothetical protein ASG60_06045 [Methylobacterium sp. Leaf469]|jgi:hypothetical protein|uniref:DUF3313 domain-containing protein n=1 Tax=unclassified Methylobacterium TaxID=2615210 RepID=UPI0006F51B98|nr:MULTISPECIES: DUF3313 domain-containing protein [unclassified Methylobacterium]USU30689.1 DUF3313 domain-containing protein [Methylobacterium sp. OTU13CASTA1]KQO70290.1 hypothetical protein ASF22_17150 [Methylobacterium sp. Leaf87]KQP24264.1 hypothetical protein ASF25_09215 [Methylobacterium sp. Leaf100]KQP60200.1 hypothetical protein ASF52_07535 [Methylobacterium sp. Leaf112]KQT92978.1 hypothetical protein ASG60_06045 [Methylobacterium sp. Leaf469]